MYLPVLEYVHSLEKNRRKQHVLKMRDNVLKFVIDLLLNVDRGVLPVDAATIAQLRPYKNVIKSLTAPKKSLRQRRREFEKRDYFKLLISPLIPAIQQMLVP